MPFIIDHTTDNDLVFPAAYSRGFDPSQVVPGTFAAPPSSMKIIPRSEWDARIADRQKYKVGLPFIRETMADGRPHVSYDQNGQGYCWNYSLIAGATYARGRDGAPYKRFSGHAAAWKIKGGRDEGGWCGLAIKFAREVGIPTVNEWPEKSMNGRHDNAATWAEAAKNKVVEDYYDLSRNVWDQQLTFDQVATCLLLNIPVQVDMNWWAHSICAIDLVRVEAGSYGLLIHNSWTDAWGDRGTAVLRGDKAIPSGAVAPAIVSAA
jgi:hypothetical protein